VAPLQGLAGQGVDQGRRAAAGKPFQVRDARVFPACLLALYTELVSYARPDAVIVANLLENGLRELGRQTRDETQSTRISTGLFAARRRIGESEGESVTLASLAATAGLSVSHFCVQFRHAFGQSAIQCLIEHRLNHAAFLLADSGLRISEIAARVGYGDAFHFSRAFKKQFGRARVRCARSATAETYSSTPFSNRKLPFY